MPLSGQCREPSQLGCPRSRRSCCWLLLLSCRSQLGPCGAHCCFLCSSQGLGRTPLSKIMKPTFLLIIFTSFFSCWCGSRQFSMLRLLGPALPEQNKLGAQVGSCPCGSYSSVPSASPSMGPLPLRQCGAARGKQQEGSHCCAAALGGAAVWAVQVLLPPACSALRSQHCMLCPTSV